MATKVKTLKDANGDILMPRTSAHAVMMGNGTTNLENKINGMLSEFYGDYGSFNDVEISNTLSVDNPINMTAWANGDGILTTGATGIMGELNIHPQTLDIFFSNSPQGASAEEIYNGQMYQLTNSLGMAKSYVADANLAINTGVYKIDAYTTNLDNLIDATGILVVYKGDEGVFQNMICHATNVVAYRSKMNFSGLWTPWSMSASSNYAQMHKLTDDFGNPISASSDLNSEINTGVYSSGSSTLNRPNDFGVLYVTRRTSSHIMQEFHSTWNNIFVRQTINGGSTWSDWVKLADANKAIVEAGSNSNGVYVKFGDGTMICRGSANVTSASTTALTGGGFRTGSSIRSFPANFSVEPNMSCSMHDTGNECTISALTSPLPSNETTQYYIQFRTVNSDSTSRTRRVDWVAVGRYNVG